MNHKDRKKLNVKLYHQGIDKKYSRLYIKMTIDNTDFIESDISQLLKTFFKENEQPFEASKTYEVCIYPEYISNEDPNNLNKILFDRAELIRATLECAGINVDLVYVFGNCVTENPKVILEIEEWSEKREKNTFVMANEDIYNKLLNYYQKLLLNIYLKDKNLTPKERKKLNGYINKKYADLPSLSEKETEEYYWAMQLRQTKDKLEIVNKKENGFLSFNLEGKVWVQSAFNKIHDDEIWENIDKLFYELASERVGKIFKHLMGIQDYNIICEILDIPYTNDQKLIIKGFIDQYGGLAFIFDEESDVAFNKLKTKMMDILNKYNFVEENANEEILEKINTNQISISEAYSILQKESSGC